MYHTLEIESIIKTFGDRQLLTDAFLHLKTGDIVGLLGRNGTGKTVFMKIIFGTEKADQKFIRLDNHKVLSVPFEHPGVIAYLPQDGYFPKRLKIDRIIHHYLNAADAQLFSENDAIVQSCMHQYVSDLSGGEQKYLEAKLLLFSNNKFVLLDEPFSSLSPLLAEKLVEQIKRCSVNKGIIVSDHNYRHIIEVATRLTIINEGVLMELTDKKGLIEQGYLPESAIY